MIQRSQTKSDRARYRFLLFFRFCRIPLHAQIPQKQTSQGILITTGPDILCDPGVIPNVQGVEPICRGISVPGCRD